MRIGRDVQLINRLGVDALDSEDGSYYIRDGIVIIPKNSLIADGTVV